MILLMNVHEQLLASFYLLPTIAEPYNFNKSLSYFTEAFGQIWRLA